MHERRNFILVLLMIAAIAWAMIVWFRLGPDSPWIGPQRAGSLIAVTGIAGWLFFALKFEDKLPNHLREVVGDLYYEAEGISFMVTVRRDRGFADLCIHYQNRFENPAQTTVHLRPSSDGFVIRPGMSDVHVAFGSGGGDFGVIRQPIMIPEKLKGEVIPIQMAAMSHFPRSHGARLRRSRGMPCGTMVVDWGGNVFRIGVHEVSNEIGLTDPVTLRLAMPKQVNPPPEKASNWTQSRLQAGPA